MFGRTVRELESTLGSDELAEWISYDRIEPLPNPWLQTGVVASTIANVMCDGKRLEPIDFVPMQREEQSVEEMHKRLKLLTRPKRLT